MNTTNPVLGALMNNENTRRYHIINGQAHVKKAGGVTGPREQVFMHGKGQDFYTKDGKRIDPRHVMYHADGTYSIARSQHKADFDARIEAMNKELMGVSSAMPKPKLLTLAVWRALASEGLLK